MLNFPQQYLLKTVSEETLAQKKKQGRCICWGCRRKVDRDRRALRCHTCQSRIKRLKNPTRYVHRMIQIGAKRRGIPFDLPFDWFKDWCEQNRLLDCRGQFRGAQTVDRIDNRLGYIPENIRVMEWFENSSHASEGDPF